MTGTSDNPWLYVTNQFAATEQEDAYRSGNTIQLTESDPAYQFLKSFEKGQQSWLDNNRTRPSLAAIDFTEDPAKSMLETAARAGALAVANLRGAKLTSLDLKNVDLRRAELNGANLHGANLQDADLRLATLSYADLTEVNLTDAILASNLIGADISGALLVNVKQFDESTPHLAFYDQDQKPEGLEELLQDIYPYEQPMALTHHEYDELRTVVCRYHVVMPQKLKQLRAICNKPGIQIAGGRDR